MVSVLGRFGGFRRFAAVGVGRHQGGPDLERLAVGLPRVLPEVLLGPGERDVGRK